MSYALRKCANSTDPRDWHYLEEWQRWGEYMPPWQWTFWARRPDLGSNIPFFGHGVCFSTDGTLPNTTNQGSDVSITLPAPDFPYFTGLFVFKYGLTVFSPSAGYVDPLGNPATVVLQGEFDLEDITKGYFMSSWWEPAYDATLDCPIRETASWTSPLHAFYPYGMLITPTRFDHPVII